MSPSRFVVPILCAAAIAFACGPRSHAGDVAAATAATATASPAAVRRPARHGSQGPMIASSLDVSVGSSARPDSIATGAAARSAVTLTFHVTNSSDKHIELTFPSGQTHDFVVLDASGRIVWRWSADRMFTQALQNRLLEAGETTSFDGRWEPGEARGHFTAVATLKSENYPIESRFEFSLP